MNVTPVNCSYTNQKNNKPVFGAKLGNLNELVVQLPGSICRGETDVFLKSLGKSTEEIKDIMFNGQGVLINVSELNKSKTMFKVTSKLEDSIGEGKSTFNVNPFLHGDGVAKRFIKAMRVATENIAEDLDYLKNQAQQVTEVING